MPDEEAAADLYEATQSLCAAAGCRLMKFQTMQHRRIAVATIRPYGKAAIISASAPARMGADDKRHKTCQSGDASAARLARRLSRKRAWLAAP